MEDQQNAESSIPNKNNTKKSFPFLTSRGLPFGVLSLQQSRSLQSSCLMKTFEVSNLYVEYLW